VHDPRLRAVLIASLPALLFTALHLRTLDYDFVWTDAGEIVGGSIIRPPDRILEAFHQPLHVVDDFASRNLSQPYYRPLQVVTASVIADRFGREPGPFRRLSLLLGAATAALFTALVLALGGGSGVALLAGCVFAAHPAGLETYVWVSGLSAALVFCAVIASLLLSVRALSAHGPSARAAFGVAALLALAVGLLCKENAAVTPVLLAAISIGLARRSLASGVRPSRAEIATAALLVALQAALVLAFFVAWRPRVMGPLAAVPPIGGELTTQILTSLALWPRALAWLFVPLQSTTSDAVRIVTSPLDPAALLGAALAVGSALAWALFLRRGWWLAAIGLAWIWIAFLPTSGLVPLLHLRAERNLFLSVFGAALLWAAAVPRLERAGVPRTLAVLAAVLLVGGLAQRSWARAPDWRSTLALFTSDVGRDPRHREGRVNLIVAHMLADRPEPAKAEVDVLVTQREPEGWTSYLMHGRALDLYCQVNERARRSPDTLRLYDAEFAGTRPATSRYPGFYTCLAPVLERAGRTGEALLVYRYLRVGAGPAERARFDVDIARCHARLDEPEKARETLAQVPLELRRGALAPEMARVRRILRRRSAAPRPGD
jgi:hypothetical protein